MVFVHCDLGGEYSPAHCRPNHRLLDPQHELIYRERLMGSADPQKLWLCFHVLEDAGQD
jgi:hypothetical protein